MIRVYHTCMYYKQAPYPTIALRKGSLSINSTIQCKKSLTSSDLNARL